MNEVERQILLNRVDGFCDLQMWTDALDELEAMGSEAAGSLRFRELKLRAMMGSKDFKRAAVQAGEFARAEPDRGAWFIHAAFCLHELGQTVKAREVLLSGPSSLKDNPLFFYNLACYECVLGRFEEARMLLAKAIEHDASLAEVAKEDADLDRLFGEKDS